MSTRPSDLATLPTAPEGSTVNILAIITLGGGAEGWSVTKIGDDTDAVIADFSPMQGDRNNNRLLITYNVSTGISRTATLRISTTGGVRVLWLRRIWYLRIRVKRFTRLFLALRIGLRP